MGKLVYDGGEITPGYLRSRAKEELVNMVMSYLGAWDGMKQRAEIAESSLSAAEKERDRIMSLAARYRVLLKDAMQFCQRTDCDGNPLNIHLARRIDAALAAKE